MVDIGADFDDFRDAFEMIAQALSQARPGSGVKVHMALIETMLDRWKSAKRIGKIDRVQARLMRVAFVRLLADRLGAQFIPTDDGNMDPDPDLYVEPSGVIFARMPPGQRLLPAGAKRSAAMNRLRIIS